MVEVIGMEDKAVIVTHNYKIANRADEKMMAIWVDMIWAKDKIWLNSIIKDKIKNNAAHNYCNVINIITKIASLN